MEAKEKIRQYLDYKGVKPYHFYRKTGLSQGFLDSGAGINSDKIKIIIENYPDINLEWLILDKGPMVIDMTKKNNPPPVINEPQAGYNVKTSDLFNYLREKDEKIEKMCKLITRLQDQNEALKKEAGHINKNIDAIP